MLHTIFEARQGMKIRISSQLADNWHQLSTRQRVNIKRRAISDRRKIKAFDFVRNLIFTTLIMFVVMLCGGISGRG